jgi:hypothetical protein
MNPTNPSNPMNPSNPTNPTNPINPITKETNVYKRRKGVSYRVEVNGEKREKDFHFFNDGEITEIRNLK